MSKFQFSNLFRWFWWKAKLFFDFSPFERQFNCIGNITHVKCGMYTSQSWSSPRFTSHIHTQNRKHNSSRTENTFMFEGEARKFSHNISLLFWLKTSQRVERTPHSVAYLRRITARKWFKRECDEWYFERGVRFLILSELIFHSSNKHFGKTTTKKKEKNKKNFVTQVKTFSPEQNGAALVID